MSSSDPRAAEAPSAPAGRTLRSVWVGAGLVGLAVAALVPFWPVAPTGGGATARAPGAMPSAHPVGGLTRTEAERADWRAQLCTGANAVGVGLRGEYFGRPGWKGDPLLVRTDATLEFDSRLDWPAEQTATARSARWSGWVRAPLTGRYRFHGDPGGVTIEVAGQAVAGPEVAEPASVEMAAGRFYPITVAWERIDPAAGPLRLQWTAPHGARFTIPRNALFLPTDTVRPVVAQAPASPAGVATAAAIRPAR